MSTGTPAILPLVDRKSTRLNSSHLVISYAVFCLKTYIFFFNDPATTEIYTLSLHDALPIYLISQIAGVTRARDVHWHARDSAAGRSEEHTSELQSPCNLVCRLLLENIYFFF